MLSAEIDVNTIGNRHFVVLQIIMATRVEREISDKVFFLQKSNRSKHSMTRQRFSRPTFFYNSFRIENKREKKKYEIEDFQ